MPPLSFDLERMIFEMAALQASDHGSRVRLALVAKRVYEWIRPILYRVVIFEQSESKEAIHDSTTNMAPFTRHLLLSVRTHSQLVQLLSTFCNVENLAIWCNRTLNSKILQKMNDLPLRMLSIPLVGVDLDEAIEYCPALRNITHFELLDLPKWHWNSNVLTTFPNLTHLCFDLPCKVRDNAVLDLLRHSPSLQVVIYLVDTAWWESDHRTHSPWQLCSHELCAAGQFLVLRDSVSPEESVAEWERSSNGQIGLWELADIIVEARNAKFFKDSSVFVFSRSTWMDDLNDDGIRWYHESLDLE